MKRVVVDRFGGPEVLRVVEDDDPRPSSGEVCVRVLAAGVSFTDAQLRAGTYLGVPKPPFTPGYELVGVVEEFGPGCSRLREGDRVGALTVWGAYAERVCVPEANAAEVPEDLDPAQLVSLVFPYMTAYQVLHRLATVKSGETVLVHGAAGRVGTAVLELGALTGLRLYGTASARDRGAVERLGAVAIDYRNEDFLVRVRELTGDGVDVVLDGIGGALSLRSFRALRRGGRLVVFGHYATLAHGRKSWRGWIEWYTATAGVALWGLLSPRRRVLGYRIQKLRDRRQWLPVGGGRRALPVGGGPRYPDWFRQDFLTLLELLREDKISPGRGRAPAAVRRWSRPRAARALSGDRKAGSRAIALARTRRRGRSHRRPGAGGSSCRPVTVTVRRACLAAAEASGGSSRGVEAAPGRYRVWFAVVGGSCIWRNWPCQVWYQTVPDEAFTDSMPAILSPRLVWRV